VIAKQVSLAASLSEAQSQVSRQQSAATASARSTRSGSNVNDEASQLEAQAAELKSAGNSQGARSLWSQASKLRSGSMRSERLSGRSTLDAGEHQRDVEALEEQLVQAQVSILLLSHMMLSLSV
jgi:hypothetical protein